MLGTNIVEDALRREVESIENEQNQKTGGLMGGRITLENIFS